MKATKIMLAVIATLIITWLTLGLVFYVLSDMTYKQSIANPDTGVIMVAFGWIPSIIVGCDVERHLNKY